MAQAPPADTGGEENRALSRPAERQDVREGGGSDRSGALRNPGIPSPGADPQGGGEASFADLARGLKLPAPVYPSLARRWGYEGVALVEITIATDGGIEEVRVLRSSGHTILDDSCIKVIEGKWRFRPAGRVVRVKKEFEFTLTR